MAARVLTTYGLGTEIEGKGDPWTALVELDVPHFESKEMRVRREEIQAWGSYALVRVVSIAGREFFSTMQFYASLDLARTAHALPGPANETRFLLDLDTGHFSANQLLKMREGYRTIEPRIDQWTKEGHTITNLDPNILARFDSEIGVPGGAGDGAWGKVLLDLKKLQVLRLAVAVPPPLGIIYRWPQDRPAAA